METTNDDSCRTGAVGGHLTLLSSDQAATCLRGIRCDRAKDVEQNATMWRVLRFEAPHARAFPRIIKRMALGPLVYTAHFQFDIFSESIHQTTSRQSLSKKAES